MNTKEYKYIATCPYCGKSVETGPLPNIKDLELTGIKMQCFNCKESYLMDTKSLIPRQ